ncbi:hypothetical protein PPTG_00265 [Phytophthora nicotianae INRA-310]|uniref:Uncharacterized protein n=3 Tax=Phytophthora nicotianae TaxID=4792 RepID=W2RGF1_PHYN3|nr:hypothetical protein PPTG_00265 [Phytophthora nicotianae INRA-310]ETN23734.1 hypothetical protein PPTG_00265 [Phytophthora nicotianae INRA-310]
MDAARCACAGPGASPRPLVAAPVPDTSTEFPTDAATQTQDPATVRYDVEFAGSPSQFAAAAGLHSGHQRVSLPVQLHSLVVQQTEHGITLQHHNPTTAQDKTTLQQVNGLAVQDGSALNES